MSLVERIDPKGVGPQHNSIIDRCTGDLYEEAEQNDTVPTLAALREKLMEQPEAEAREIRPGAGVVHHRLPGHLRP